MADYGRNNQSGNLFYWEWASPSLKFPGRGEHHYSHAGKFQAGGFRSGQGIWIIIEAIIKEGGLTDIQ